MSFLKNLGRVVGVVVGGAAAVALAPVVGPVVAAAGTAVAGAAAAAGTAAAGAAAAAGTAVAGAAAAAGTAAAGAATAAGTAVAGAAAAVGGTVAAGATAAAGAVGTVAGTVGTTIASSAVGTAVSGTMASVGSVVGTAANAVGLTSVGTVTGTTAGATAVGTITTAGTVGTGNAVSGVYKMNKASKIASQAKRTEEDARKSFDKTESETNKSLEKLGRQKIEIWNQFNEFETLFSKISNIEISGKVKLDEKLCLDKDKMDDVHVLAVKAEELMGKGTAALTAGSLIGVATSTGITSVATASTGTSIASLHGAAAINAAKAALGGGSLKAGGLGMAGGAVVANALTFAPVVAIGGLFLNGMGNNSLKEASDAMGAAQRSAHKMEQAEVELGKLRNLANNLFGVLSRYDKILSNLLVWLRKLTDRECDANQYSDEELTKVFATYRVVEILYNLTTAELYSTDNDKIVVASDDIMNAIKDSEDSWKEYSGSVA